MNIISMVREFTNDTQTKGIMLVLDETGKELFRCFTLELPWRNNERRVSCIPAGRYKMVHRTSQRFGHHLHILDIENRSLILIHQANFVRQLEGCIAVGRERIDLDGDGNLDVTSSVATMRRLMELIPEESMILISWLDHINPELNG